MADDELSNEMDRVLGERTLTDELAEPLEDLACMISGDWGGSAIESRAVIATAYLLGVKDGANLKVPDKE
jgi:hypothetical protein